MRPDTAVDEPGGILETALYANDLAAAETFYRDVLGLEPFQASPAGIVFYRCGNQVLLIFNPEATKRAAGTRRAAGAAARRGRRRACLLSRVRPPRSMRWRTRLQAKGVAIEADFEWPSGGRSIYFRDPAGNCLEFAEPRIWSST